MKQYTVTGMSCAACSARVEKAVSKVDGVTSCSVSLLTNSMGVEGSATDAQIVEAVEQAGYGASPKGTATESDNDKANNSLEQLKAAQDALVDTLLLNIVVIAAGHTAVQAVMLNSSCIFLKPLSLLIIQKW